MLETTGTIIANPMPVIVIDGKADYNQAIDDACHALEATGENEAWQTVRSLREPKMPL